MDKAENSKNHMELLCKGPTDNTCECIPCAAKCCAAGIIKLSACMHAKLLQSCPALCEPMDCSPPGSSVHGILQARILEWVAMRSEERRVGKECSG